MEDRQDRPGRGAKAGRQELVGVHHGLHVRARAVDLQVEAQLAGRRVLAHMLPAVEVDDQHLVHAHLGHAAHADALARLDDHVVPVADAGARVTEVVGQAELVQDAAGERDLPAQLAHFGAGEIRSLHESSPRPPGPPPPGVSSPVAAPTGAPGAAPPGPAATGGRAVLGWAAGIPRVAWVLFAALP